MTRRPFRILIIDDSSYEQRGLVTRDARRALTGHAALLHWLADLEKQRTGSLEVYLSLNVALLPQTTIRISQPNQPVAFLEKAEDALRFLEGVDVLILDLQGTGASRRAWRLTEADVPGVESEVLAELNGGGRADWGSIGFFLKHRKGVLRDCGAIIVMTQYDGTGTPMVKRFVESACHPDAEPWTVMHPTSEEGVARVRAVIEGLHHDFAEGYSQLHSRGAIEFAASHDHPVLIVGESGSGKEYIAHSIHRRWVQEKRRKGIEVPNHMVVLNCGALLPSLARSELFGHVLGAFSGAVNHQLGKMLEACGIKLRSDRGFRESLLLENRGRFNESQVELELRGSGPDEDGPLGCLFLDEFGDLPVDVQVMLLRALQQPYEVQPVGAPRILGVRLRILAATSDPRVAAAIGIRISEPARPGNHPGLRNDLLFRVAWQRIRAQGVRLDHVFEDVMKVVQTRSASPGNWRLDAVQCLVDHVQMRMKAAQQVGEGSTFGHWREVVQQVTLIDEFVRTATARGLRTLDSDVTPEIVKALVTEMVVSSTDAQIRALRPELLGKEPRWLLQDFVRYGTVLPETNEYELILRMLERPNLRLQFEDVHDLYQGSGKSAFTPALSRLKKKVEPKSGWTLESGKAGFGLFHRGSSSG